MNSGKDQKGAGFEVWTSQESWFWMVSSPHANGGMIGAAATEAEAIREARSSMKRISSSRRAVAISPRTRRMVKVALREPQASISALWETSLNNLDRYLACACAATA